MKGILLMIKLGSKPLAYFLMPLDEFTGEDIFPCIAVQNEPGYYRTDWNWGKDWKIASEACENQNAKLGLTRVEAAMIVASSIAAQECPAMVKK
jgi:hypothetical protein